MSDGVKGSETHGLTKAFRFGDTYVYMMFAGDDSTFARLSEDIEKIVVERHLTRTRDIEEICREQYMAFRQKRKDQGNLSNEQADLGTDLLIFGIDDGVAHLYVVTDPGNDLDCRDRSAYCAIGEGYQEMESQIKTHGYDAMCSTSMALVIGYIAKQRAYHTFDSVGSFTDGFFLLPGRDRIVLDMTAFDAKFVEYIQVPIDKVAQEGAERLSALLDKDVFPKLPPPGCCGDDKT